MSFRPFSSTQLPSRGSGALSGRSEYARDGATRRVLELVAVAMLAAAGFLLLALLSFRADPRDPSVSGSDWGGPVGASLAGWLVAGFGAVALLLPVELGSIGVSILSRQGQATLNLRIASVPVLGILLASLVEIIAPGMTAMGGMPAAGNVGLLFGELMRGLFSTLGSLLIDVTLLVMAVAVRSSQPVAELWRRLSSVLGKVGRGLWALWRRLYGAWTRAGIIRRGQSPTEPTATPPIQSASRDAVVLAELVAQSTQTGIDPDAVPELTVARTPSSDVRAGAESAFDIPTPPAAPVSLQPSASPDDSEDCTPSPNPQTAVLAVRSAARMERTSARSGDSDLVAVCSGSSAARRRENGPSTDTVGPEPAPARNGPPRIVQRSKEPTPRTSTPTPPVSKGFSLPETSLLLGPSGDEPQIDRDRILAHAQRLERTLLDYGVQGKVEEIHPGPTVTTYEVSPQAGTKVSKVAGLADDLALGLSRKVRIIAPIPGKSRIGFELPNDQRIPVNLRELVEDPRFLALSERLALPVVLGRDIVGAPFYADLAALPHVIVAGATGAGKSVGLNVMLASLLFRRTPEQMRLLLIDPKVVELAPFDGIPHLLLPVVTDMKQASVALRWAVDEMERRYQLFATAGTKNISTYNRWVDRVVRGEDPVPPRETVDALRADGSVVAVPAAKEGEDGRQLPARLPYIVIVIDEFADLMMQQGKEVEAAIARLAQKARAAGLHVLLATQRPSVDVITGMIKANFPSRIAYLVAQKVDSRTILDEQGAELLLGRGDMLVKLNGSNDLKRVQCPFIGEDEVASLTEHLRRQARPQYHDAILQTADDEAEAEGAEVLDPRFDEAVRIVADTQRCSTSWLQRKMTIGYNRAAKIVEAMERRGIVGPPNGAKDREVLVSPA